MSFFVLKLLAVITMLIDHIGAFLLPDVEFLRIIGRISFPIFAFCIANGYRYTKNKYKYMLRLLIGGIISIFPYSILHGPGYFRVPFRNIFFTLLLGLLCIFFFDNAKKKRKGLKNIISLGSAIMVFVCLSFSNILSVEYGLFGVALVLLYHFVIDSKVGIIMVSVWMNLILEMDGLCGSLGVTKYTAGWYLSNMFDLNFHAYQFIRGKYYIGQWCGMFAAIPLCLYNGKKGYSAKWLQWVFYLFYPVHLFILFMIKC